VSKRPDGEASNASDLTVQAVVLNGMLQSLVYRPGRFAPPPGTPATIDTMASESASMILAAFVLLGPGLLSLAAAFPHRGSDYSARPDLRHRSTSARRPSSS